MTYLIDPIPLAIIGAALWLTPRGRDESPGNLIGMALMVGAFILTLAR